MVEGNTSGKKTKESLGVEKVQAPVSSVMARAIHAEDFLVLWERQYLCTTDQGERPPHEPPRNPGPAIGGTKVPCSSYTATP